MITTFVNIAVEDNSSGKHNVSHGHNMSQWMKITDLESVLKQKSVVFTHWLIICLLLELRHS